jgi:hypothetical protein
MVFDIRFLGERTDHSEVGNAGYLGEIVLGSERETFLSLIGFWSPHDYQRQWIRGIRRLIQEGTASCLITSLHDPLEADVISWWLLYPVGSDVYLQEALLLLGSCRDRFSTRDPYAVVPPRRKEAADGDEVSEWLVPREDFVLYLRRHDGQSR